MMLLDFLKNIKSLIGDTIFEKLKNPYFMTSKKKIFFYAIYIWKTTKENFKMEKKNKNIIYSNMGYNKYMTEHVEPDKYFYVRGGILKKRSKYCKVEDCFKISSYGSDKIERCLNHRLNEYDEYKEKTYIM